jgi:hypothetical protein
VTLRGNVLFLIWRRLSNWKCLLSNSHLNNCFPLRNNWLDSEEGWNVGLQNVKCSLARLLFMLLCIDQISNKTFDLNMHAVYLYTHVSYFLWWALCCFCLTNECVCRILAIDSLITISGCCRLPRSDYQTAHRVLRAFISDMCPLRLGALQWLVLMISRQPIVWPSANSLFWHCRCTATLCCTGVETYLMGQPLAMYTGHHNKLHICSCSVILEHSILWQQLWWHADCIHVQLHAASTWVV